MTKFPYVQPMTKKMRRDKIKWGNKLGVLWYRGMDWQVFLDRVHAIDSSFEILPMGPLGPLDFRGRVLPRSPSELQTRYLDLIVDDHMHPAEAAKKSRAEYADGLLK